MAEERNPPLLHLSIFLSDVGGFLFGYDTGVIAGAMPLVEKTRNFFPDNKSKSSNLQCVYSKNQTV